MSKIYINHLTVRFGILAIQGFTECISSQTIRIQRNVIIFSRPPWIDILLVSKFTLTEHLFHTVSVDYLHNLYQQGGS